MLTNGLFSQEQHVFFLPGFLISVCIFGLPVSFPSRIHHTEVAIQYLMCNDSGVRKVKAKILCSKILGKVFRRELKGKNGFCLFGLGASV